MLLIRKCKYIYTQAYLHSTGRLTEHRGIIPEDEIWVKIGGDKGGKSMKISFQISTTLSPNSV